MKNFFEDHWELVVNLVIIVMAVCAVACIGMEIVHEAQQNEVQQYQYDQHMRDAGCTGIYDHWWSDTHPKQWSCPPGAKP